MIRACDLQGKRVFRENGEALGRVFEIRLSHSEVAALICGVGGLLQRLAGLGGGHRVAWSDVRKITSREIIVADRGSRKMHRRRQRTAG